MAQVRIVWNGPGGELDSAVVECDGQDGDRITAALIEMIGGGNVHAGDSFTVREVE